MRDQLKSQGIVNPPEDFQDVRKERLIPWLNETESPITKKKDEVLVNSPLNPIIIYKITPL